LEENFLGMKRFTALFVFVMMAFIGGRSWGQNLVPNPSFEIIDSSNCPGDIIIASPWFGNSPDYFHTNNASEYCGVNAPSNIHIAQAYQFPRTGDAYCGFGFQLNFNPNDPNLREYPEVKLLSPLVEGKVFRKIVLPTTFANSKARLNTSGLPDGIYLLQIINDKTGVSEVGKFVEEE
jgi:hypothetical protein